MKLQAYSNSVFNRTTGHYVFTSPVPVPEFEPRPLHPPAKRLRVKATDVETRWWHNSGKVTYLTAGGSRKNIPPAIDGRKVVRVWIRVRNGKAGAMVETECGTCKASMQRSVHEYMRGYRCQCRGRTQPTVSKRSDVLPDMVRR